MSDYLEVRNIVEEIIEQAGDFLNIGRFLDCVKVLTKILNYPQQYIEMEKYREAYEILVKVIHQSKTPLK